MKCNSKECEFYEELCNRQIVIACEKCKKCMSMPHKNEDNIPEDHQTRTKMDDGSVCPHCYHINYPELDLVSQPERNDVEYLERDFDTDWRKNGMIK